MYRKPLLYISCKINKTNNAKINIFNRMFNKKGYVLYVYVIIVIFFIQQTQCMPTAAT